MSTAQAIELIGQICGLIIIVTNPLAMQFPKRWQMLLMLSGVNFLSVINQLCVGSGFASATVCGVAMLHCAVNSYKSGKGREIRTVENVVWSAVYFAALGVSIFISAQVGAATWLDVFPVLGTVAFLGSVLCKREQTIRKFTFVNCLIYFVYNIINLNVTAVSQLIAMISIVIALYRYREKKPA